MNHYLLTRIIGISSIIAGFLHVTVVSIQHWTLFPPLESGFFIVGGLFQIFLGLLFIMNPSVIAYRMGLLFNGGMAALYFLMQFLPVPFVNEAENIEVLGVIVSSIEVISVLASLNWIYTYNKMNYANKKFILTFASAMSVIIIGSLGYYGSGQAFAMLLPNRKIEHSHGSETSHDEMDTEHHIKSKTEYNVVDDEIDNFLNEDTHFHENSIHYIK